MTDVWNAFGWPYFGQGPVGPVSTTQDVNVPLIASNTVVYAATLVANIPLPFISSHTVLYGVQLPEIDVPFIATHTTVYALQLPTIPLPFISSVTVVYALQLPVVPLPFISSHTVLYTITLQLEVPFIPSHTVVYGIFSLFTDTLRSGPGNGGEGFLIRLAANGASQVATLAATINATATLLTLTGDGGMPSAEPFVVTIDSEVLYIAPMGSGSYRIRGRAVSNTAAASHTVGANVTWNDTYDMAISATNDIAATFTANITGSGSTAYPGWLICFDSTQAYNSGGSRYPFHVTSVLGVFDFEAGSGGTNRCDAAQPNAVCTTATVSDDCPAALSNPSRISTDILTGDVALCRYTNPEAFVLDLGSRSTSLQSWFGMMRVDASDVDVTFTDPTGYIVDSNPPAHYTGSVNGEWLNPLGPGIAPWTGLPTSHNVPYTSVTLPGVDRFFTYGPPGYNRQGWPICALAVRQGFRRVPLWESWDWHNFNYVFSGFFTDATYCQMLINRNGIVFGNVPEVALPGPQDIDGPDAVWDDGSYYFGASWYVALFSTPYLVVGPSIGGSGIPSSSTFNYVPTVTFPGGPSSPSVSTPSGPPPVEGGSGGDVNPPGASKFSAALV